MNIAIIVLTWNAAETALECLKTIAEQQRAPEKILVVDNASADDTVERIGKEFPDIPLVRNARNLGFSAGMNVGIETLRTEAQESRHPPPDLVALLNQDTLLAPDWLEHIAAPFESNAELGAAGCKIRYNDGTLQHAGAYLERPRAVARHIGWKEADNGQYEEQTACEMVTGAAIALRMSALDTVGLFDTGYTPAYYEDVDLCWRLREGGYQIHYIPNAVVTHHESLSIRNDVSRISYYHRGRLRFVLKSTPIDELLGRFAQAEYAYIAERQSETVQVEERPLRWAYLDTIGRLPEIIQARNAFHPPLSNNEQAELLRMLLRLKHTVTLSYSRRASETIGAFRTI
jgi:GT2 family glycosyltransferase